MKEHTAFSNTRRWFGGAARALVAVAAIAFAGASEAATEAVGGYTWTYYISGDTAVIYNAGSVAVSPKPEGSLTIPASLGGKTMVSLGSHALMDCASLKTVTIPASVTEINVYAVDGCSAIESYSVESGNQNYKSVNGLLLTKDGKTLVRGVNGDVVIPDGVTEIGTSAFDRLDGVLSVKMPDSMTIINDFAFYKCSALESIEIPDGVARIGGHAFYRCTSLWDVDLGNGVTNIESSAFGDCTSLTSVTIPSQVKVLGNRAFNRSGLTQVNFEGPVGEITADFNSVFTNTTYCTTVNANDKFANAKEISGASGIVTGLNIFATDESDEPIMKEEDDASRTMWFKWTAPSGAKAALFHTCWSDFDTILGVFTGSSRLSLTAVATADDGCDDNTSKVKFAVTGGTTYYICVAGYLLARGSFQLAWSTFSGTRPVYVNSYGTLCGVAGDCPSMLNIPSYGDSSYAITRIATSAFNATSYDPSAKNITSVSIPDMVTSVGMNAFWGCNGSVFDTTTVPGVKLVDGWAVEKTGSPSGDLDLTGIKGIADGTFQNCTGLTGVTIPSGVKGIGKTAFWYCTGLTSVTIPDSVTYIGKNAFCGCSKLESVTLPVRFYEAGFESWAFSKCSANLRITYVDYSTGVEFVMKGDTLIGVRLNGATSVTIPAGVTAVADGAFDSCYDLTSVTIPASVTSIHVYAFDYCRGLRSFTVASGNPAYKAVNGLLLTKDGKTLVQGIVGESGAVTIPVGVTTIGDSAFYGLTRLTGVTLPADVETIEDNAFSVCSGLKSFTVAAGNPNYKAVDGFLFTKDGKTLVVAPGGLTGSVTIPSSVTSIGKGAFYDCIGLTSVTIPDGVTSIGIWAFESCSSLTSVTIPSSVTSIGAYAFSDCSSLTSVMLPKRFDGNLGWSVFYGCPESLVITYYDSATYTVRYRKYDGSGETAEEDFECDKTYRLAWMDSQLSWMRYGYEFCGWVPWNPDTKPRLCKYDNGQPVKDLAAAGETIELYCGWKSASSYRVCFHRCAGPDDLVKMNQVILRNKETGLAWMDSQICWKRDGYSFAGWDESDKAATVKYANGAKVTNLAMNGGTKHLYAVWRAKDDHKYPYTVKFYKYDGSGETRTQSFKAGTVQSLLWLESQLGWKRDGYEFCGWVPWNPDAKARLCKYVNGQKVVDLASKSGETVNLYAAWKSKSSYRVCFHMNDGTDVKMNQVILRNKEDSLAWMDSQIGWKRDGYKFAGWAETAKGPVKYANGAKVKNLAMDGGTKHLYAVWKLAD